MLNGLSETMVFSIRIFHQSRDALNPSRNCGLQTTPTVCDFDVSGCRSGLERDRNGTGVAVLPLLAGTRPAPNCRKVSASAPMSRAQLARVVGLLAELPN